MIVNKYNNGGGGSSSGVTPQDVQQQIDSALTPYWESAETQSAITEAVSGLASEEYVQEALSGVNLDGYYTSAQTESAITMAVSGKADAANVTANSGSQKFPKWNSQGIITGETSQAYFSSYFYINDTRREPLFNRQQDASATIRIYTPTTSGETGQILTPSGNTPVWVTPATINGSAITSGGNIEIQGGADMSAFWTSAETKDYVDGLGEVVATSLNQLNDDLEAPDSDVMYNARDWDTRWFRKYVVNMDDSGGWNNLFFDLNNGGAATEMFLRSADGNYLQLEGEDEAWYGFAIDIDTANSANNVAYIENIPAGQYTIEYIKNYTDGQMEDGSEFRVTWSNMDGDADELFVYGTNTDDPDAGWPSEDYDKFYGAHPRFFLSRLHDNPYELNWTFEQDVERLEIGFDGDGDPEVRVIYKGDNVHSSDGSINNIIRIEQSDYDQLVNDGETDGNTLYVVVPDSM